MKAILMAAGKGTRISRHLGETPKCTLDVGGQPLIRRTVNMLLANGVAVSVVVGYKKHTVMDCLAGLPLTYFHNPFYDVTNSIASLWFARSAICAGQDLVVANADVYWEQGLLDALAKEQRDPVMLADSSRVDEGDYFFKFTDSRLSLYGKDLRRKDISGEYVGIAKVGQTFQNILLGRLQDMVNAGRSSLWWEDVLYSFIADGQPIYVKDIAGQFWSEIDFIEDYQRILRHIQRTAIRPLHGPDGHQETTRASKGSKPARYRSSGLAEDSAAARTTTSHR